MIKNEHGQVSDAVLNGHGGEDTAHLASFPEKNPNPVVELDVARGLITYMNPAALAQFPALAEKGINHPVIKPLLSHANAIYKHQICAAHESSFSERVFEVRLCGTKSNFVHLYFFEITEKKLLEQKVHQSEKMEAVGRLAGGIAHDFNNLMSIVVGFSDVCMGEIPEEHSAHKFLTEIKKAGEDAANLTRQLLAFARKQIVEPVLMDLNDVIYSLENFIHHVAGENIELNAVRAPDIWLMRADEMQIKQIIMNLVLNARDAMPNGGHLHIETENMHFTEGRLDSNKMIPAGEYVRLRVRDTGEGMEPGMLSHIFEPFFTTKEKGRGTGLGLATVYSIVKQSGGYIAVHSEKEKGTLFHIYFPRAEGDTGVQPRPEKEEKTTLPRGTETLLVVEDEDGVRFLVTELLRELGYTVLEAQNGEDALSKLESMQGKNVQLILSDVVMPKMGGLSLLEHIKKSAPNVKMLLMTGYSEDVLDKTSLADVGAPLLQKPFTPEVLARKVRQLLDSK